MPTFTQPGDEDASNASASRSRSPLKFFSLLFALSIPFYLVGAVTGLQLLPGLPVSALAVVCPATAASILVYRENGTVGVIALLKRSFDYERIRSKVWYAPIVLLMPGVSVSTYWVMRWMARPLPTPEIPILATLVMFAAFFVGALGEELGWSGYAIDPMQVRWNALQAGILLGLVQLFPNRGSHWDPFITGVILAVAAAIVTIVWGPGTLAGYGNGRADRRAATS